MKNILTTSFVIMLSILCFSFTIDDTKTSRSVQDLSSDARFINFVQDQVKATDKVKDFDAFEPFFDKTNLSNADITTISSLLGFRNRTAYENHLSKQSEVIKTLDEQYNLSQYTEAQLVQFRLDALNTSRSTSRSMNETPMDVDPQSSDGVNECRKACIETRVECILDAAIDAGIRHLTCTMESTNPASELICHIIADVIQIKDIGKCVRDCRDCLEDCEDD